MTYLQHLSVLPLEAKLRGQNDRLKLRRVAVLQHLHLR